MITKADQAAITARSREALALLTKLRAGDRVIVRLDSGDAEMTVSREARRSDGAYGSWESTRVTVTFGPGRYSTEISADGVGHGYQAIRRAA